MEKYKSVYPTLRQAKTKWSKPSIVAKQGEGPSHDWYEMMKKDARAKLAASIHQSHAGSIHKQERIVREEAEGEEHLYHVTHTKHVGKIQKQGLRPMQTSNWVKAGDKERYGSGEVYTFTHKDDAHQWAGRMDWAHHQKLGSGNISIVTVKKPKDHQFEVDHNDPLSQAGQKGKWLKTQSPIGAHHIVSVEKYAPKKLGEDRVPVYGFKTQLQNVRMKETGVKKRKNRMTKDPRPTDFSRPDLKEVAAPGKEEWIKANKARFIAKYGKEKGTKILYAKAWKDSKKLSEEDKIGKPTPSAESIAKKHNKDIAEIQAQIDKGIKVEREHTKSDAEAHEIARDHLDEFPDYYDRLDKMEKQAKKDMKEGAEQYNPEKELLRGRIEAHKDVAAKMAAKHGEKSVEASFHRALVKRYEKELGEDLKEEVANSVGGGMSPTIGGEGNIHGFDPIMGKSSRRKRFAGKQVFVVDPTTYHKAYLGKRKYEHYEKYLEGSPFAEEIRAYGRKYWDEPIILQNEQTGAMVYLKYGSK